MKSQPHLAFRFPLLAELVRHGVAESKGDEINCSFLLSVRKTIRCKTDVIVWIEELEFGRFQDASVSNRRG
jgi:hypothetical protein